MGTRRMRIGGGNNFTMRNCIIYKVIKSRKLRWPGHIAIIEEVRSAFKIFTEKLAGTRHLGTPRHRWENNIRMVLKEKSANTRNCINSAQDMDY